MAKLVKILKGQSVTEQLDAINTSVENINKELEQVTSNENGFITEDEIPVKSVQGKTGDVSLSAKDVGAFPNSSTIKELDINNLKSTGVYIGTYAGNPYYLVVIKYNDTNIYQELIGLNFKKYRRFTTTWSEWIQEYSNENPVKASDITGINIVDTDKELTLALLEDTTFVKADIKYNPSTKSLYVGDDKFATEQFVRNAVNMIQSIIVTELPSVGVENTIYFVPTGAEGGNIFNEYLYVNNAWEIVGGTSVDLTSFLTKEEAEQTYAKISSLDDKVSKTTTINGKTLYNNITLTAEDIGALSKDTILVEDVVYRHTNEEISGKLTAGAFVENDLVIAIDTGTYLQGHMYKYNSGTLTDITDIITDYVDLNSDQNINGTKNFNGVLRYGGVNVATEEDISTATSSLVPNSSNLIMKTIDSVFIRITDYDTGIYRLTNTNEKYILYNGATDSSRFSSIPYGELILIINKATESYWNWYCIANKSTYPAIYYGYTSTTTGYMTSKSINSLLTSVTYPYLNSTRMTSSSEMYAPTVGGTSGYILKSNGDTSTPTWEDINNLIDIPDTSSFAKTSDLNNYVPTTRTINSKTLSSNISLEYGDVKALPNYSLTIGNTNGGNPRQVLFTTVNYSNFTSEGGAYFKLSAMSGHGNGSAYTFVEDIFINVNYLGAISCDVYKYVQKEILLDGVTRNYGDVFWVVDTTNKIVYFYILLGQYSQVNLTPAIKIGATKAPTEANGIKQYTGSPTYYSSGTKVWANGNSSTYVRSTDVPTIVTLTQAEYDALTTKDSNTYYFIREE